MKTLNNNQIKKIDDYLLKQGVRFMDVRLELLDHLASEFEKDSEYVLLEDFLSKKKYFIRNFERKRQKSMHWSYQNRLWKRMLMFLYRPEYIVAMLLIFGGLYFVFNLLSVKISLTIILLALVIPQVLQFVAYYRPSKMYKRVQSFQFILSIMSLPSIFLYMLGVIKGWLLPENEILFFVYCFVAVLFNLAGILEVYQIKKELLQQYNDLISA